MIEIDIRASSPKNIVPASKTNGSPAAYGEFDALVERLEIDPAWDAVLVGVEEYRQAAESGYATARANSGRVVGSSQNKAQPTGMGMFAHVADGSGEFARHSRAEIDREDVVTNPTKSTVEAPR